MAIRKFLREALPLRSSKARDRRRSDPEPSLHNKEENASDNWVKVEEKPDDFDEKLAAPRPSATFPLPDNAPPPPIRRYNTAPIPAYNYVKLPEFESLRVLELLPGKGEDPIVTKLHLTDWNDPMPFEAISYAWGDPKIQASIECNGKKLDITPNLVDCLHQLRRPNESRYLWADAACINQKDLEERGHQVDNMRRIYECAQKLLIWLGRDDGGYAHRVQSAMLELAQKCCTAKNQNIDELYKIDNLWETVSYPPYKVAMPLESWQAIEKLFLCSWFSRLW